MRKCTNETPFITCLITKALLTLMAIASLTMATHAGQTVIKVSRDAHLTDWKAYYGKPFKIAGEGDQFYWHVGRLEVEATLFSNGNLSSFDISAVPGKAPLKMSEAVAIADNLGLPPYHIEDGSPIWGDLMNDDVTAFFEDADFHCQASQDNDPSPNRLTREQAEEIARELEKQRD